MRKYLVNYRVVQDSITIPYLKYTAIYKTQGVMTQEDIEAFEKAKTEEHVGRIVTMVGFYELKHSTPMLEDYIEALPYLSVESDASGKMKFITTNNDWAYIPTLYKFEGEWVIDWIDSEESDSLEVIKGITPFEAAKNAYNWCVEKGYIKDTLNNKQIMIKEVPDPTLMCEGCVYDGKFECIQHACCADPNNPVKYIEVTE